MGLLQEILLLKSDYWLPGKQLHNHKRSTKGEKRHKPARVLQGNETIQQMSIYIGPDFPKNTHALRKKLPSRISALTIFLFGMEYCITKAKEEQQQGNIHTEGPGWLTQLQVWLFQWQV